MKLTIIGASGHGKVAADIARLCGYDEIEFLDDNPEVSECAGYPVVGTSAGIEEIHNDLFIAIGNSAVRRRLMAKCAGKRMPALIHPNAVIARDATIGDGTVVMAGAVINSCAEVGRGVIVNTCSSIDHDCVVADFSHISVGAHLCGTVGVGAGTWVGAGAVVSNNVEICGDCMIGAGAVVVRDILQAGTYVGVPARRIRPADSNGDQADE